MQYINLFFLYLFNSIFKKEKDDEKNTNGEYKIVEKKAKGEDKIAEANISK